MTLFRDLDSAAARPEKLVAAAETRFRASTGRIPTPEEILKQPQIVSAIAYMRACGLAPADGHQAWCTKQLFPRVDWKKERPQ